MRGIPVGWHVLLVVVYACRAQRLPLLALDALALATLLLPFAKGCLAILGKALASSSLHVNILSEALLLPATHSHDSRPLSRTPAHTFAASERRAIV